MNNPPKEVKEYQDIQRELRKINREYLKKKRTTDKNGIETLRRIGLFDKYWALTGRAAEISHIHFNHRMKGGNVEIPELKT